MIRRQSLKPDYDENPDRFLGGANLISKHWLVDDVHEDVARRLGEAGAVPVLDLGCGNGRLIRHLIARNIDYVGLDASIQMLTDGVGSRVMGDATQIPFPDESMGGVAALYMLYHFDDPVVVAAESHRVLRPGGIFVASTPSRYDDPELADFLPPTPPATFDAEIGPDLIGKVFEEVEVEPWDEPIVHLRDYEAVVAYLYHHNLIPREQGRQIAEKVSTPLTLTKRGALIWGYKKV